MHERKQIIREAIRCLKYILIGYSIRNGCFNYRNNNTTRFRERRRYYKDSENSDIWPVWLYDLLYLNSSIQSLILSQRVFLSPWLHFIVI